MRVFRARAGCWVLGPGCSGIEHWCWVLGAGASRARARSGHRVELAPKLGSSSRPSSRTDVAPRSLLRNATSAVLAAFSISIWSSVRTLVTSSDASAITWSIGLWAAEISSRNTSVGRYLMPTALDAARERRSREPHPASRPGWTSGNRARRGETIKIAAVARARVSAFSLRLLAKVRSRLSISFSVFLSTGWIVRRIHTGEHLPKCSNERTKCPGSRQRRRVG